MSEQKHTPGPWTWSKIKNKAEYDYLEGVDGLVISCDYESSWDMVSRIYVEVENDADAALIAAAPDMAARIEQLEAELAELVDVLDRVTEFIDDATYGVTNAGTPPIVFEAAQLVAKHTEATDGTR